MTPAVQSMAMVTAGEASAYLEEACDDELRAAVLLACDRCRLVGSLDPPDAEEIHHALFLLRRARGLPAPSFDAMRVELRAKLAA